MVDGSIVGVHQHGTPKKQLDVSRLKALGWSAQIPLNQGLPMAFEDFKHAEAAQLIRQR